MATIPVFADFDMNQNHVANLRIQNVAVHSLTPVTGQVEYLTTTNVLEVWNGTAWVPATAAAPGVAKFAATIGPGVGPFVVTHNLGTLDTVESVYNIATGVEVVAVVTHSSLTTTTFAITPALVTAARATIIG